MLAGLVPNTRYWSSFRALLAAHARALGVEVSVDQFLAAFKTAGYMVDDDLMVYGLLTEEDFLAALELERQERWHCRFCLDPCFVRLEDGSLLCINCHPCGHRANSGNHRPDRQGAA